MPTDFERELSELLHSVTPEPPANLARPRVATLLDESRSDVDPTVIELVRGSGHAPRQRRGWSVIGAAAAVAILAAGVIALIQTSTIGHPATHPPAGPTTTGITPTPNGAAAPQCRENQFTLADGPALATHGRTGIAHFSYLNDWARPCESPAPRVAITVASGAEPTGGWTFPANPQTVQIPGHGQVVFTAYVRITGRCHTVSDGGFRINVTHGSTTVSWSLGVAGCTLTPLHLTHRIGG